MQALAKATFIFGIVALSLTNCALKSVYVKPDFDRVEKFQLKRIGVFSAPIPNAPPTASALLARIARHYILQQKNYLAVVDGKIGQQTAWKTMCTIGDKRLDGVVLIQLHQLSQNNKQIEADGSMTLWRCDNGAMIWQARVSDENEKTDDDLEKLTQVYREEFGVIANTYAAPFFVISQTAFKSLPSPQLTDEETLEKIELAD